MMDKMRSVHQRFIARSSNWLAPLLLLAICSTPLRAAEPSNTRLPGSVQRLQTMFSPEIRATLNACHSKGNVNVASGASPQGTVICGNGSTEAGVRYESYLDTTADLLAASGLVGLRAAIAANPVITPEMAKQFLASPRGIALLRNLIGSTVSRTGMAASRNLEQSTAVMTDRVVARIQQTLQATDLNQLLGTSEQYRQVVQTFCTNPGTTVAQAQQVAKLSSTQLYAICVQESGLANEILQGRAQGN